MEASARAEDADGLGTIRTRVPGRLDRLPWSRFHWRVVIGLGIVWILDGLEVTIVGFLAPTLVTPGSGIEFTDSHIALGAIALRRWGLCWSAFLRAAHRPLRS